MKKILFAIVITSVCIVRAQEAENVLSAIEAATGWTAEELANGLAMLDRVYSNDCQTLKGRERWHGKCVDVSIDTNLLVKVQRYADGFVHTERFSESLPPSVRDQLSAAERRAVNAARAAKAKADAERKRQERIDLLTTNLTAETTKLMEQKQWPEELARLYLQTELNKLVGTNTVDITINPGD